MNGDCAHVPCRGRSHNMRCGAFVAAPHVFSPSPALPGFVHLPLQRRDVGEGTEHVGAVQAVAHRFLTSDPPQRLNRPPLCFTRWGGENLSLQNLRGWRINFGIRHEFHELARILFLLIRVNSCNSWQKRL